MHEAGVMQEILEEAARETARRGANHIYAVSINVGEAAGVDVDSLTFAFEALSPGTQAEGAELRIISVPVVCFCRNCGVEFTPPDLYYVCPSCATISSEIITGRDLELASLEVS